jgi:hypothetical protein
MSGSLVKIQETIISSSTASVTLTGIDSTYDVYMVKHNNVFSDTDGSLLSVRFTVSGTPDTSANYDRAFKVFQTNTTYADAIGTNQTSLLLDFFGTAGNEQANGIFYCFNFNNASEYSFITLETTERIDTGVLRGLQGGTVLTVAQATDGIHFFLDSGNFTSGTFTLYGLKK